MRIPGTIPAEKCVELLTDKLKTHQISLWNDIVAIMTDGAAVMKKVGRLISASQQLCFAHGLQLGVINVLYKVLNQSEMIDNDVDDSSESDSNSNYDESNDDYSDCDEAVNSAIEIKYAKELITKVRKIVSLFKRSPVNNDNFCKNMYGPRIQKRNFADK